MPDLIVDDAPRTGADPGARPGVGPGVEVDTALVCLVLAAQHHGVRLSVEGLKHRFALAGTGTTAADLLRVAEGSGFKAMLRRAAWEDLVDLPGGFPLLARLSNGNTVVLVGVGRRAAGEEAAEEAGEEAGEGGRPEPVVGVFDPLADRPGIIELDREAFTRAWTGELVFLKPRLRLDDPDQPFGLRWFVPEILRQGRAFRDVLVAAVVLHALALLVPIYFQIVIDKVLVHQAVTTLEVLTVGILAALAFEAAFRFLRQFILLSAANRIDIRLLNRTFGRLLDLPIGFFDVRSAGVTVRHMQQVERIREFLTGQLFSTALDSLALLVFLPFLFLYSVKLALVVLGFALAIALVMAVLVPVYRDRLQALYTADAERQAMLVETIHGMRTVKSSALEPQQRRLWDRRAAQVVTMHYQVGKTALVARTATEFLEKAMTVAIVAVGAFDVFDREMTVGALVAFQMLSGRVVTPLVQMVGLIHQYQEALLSVRMLGEVMNHPPEARREGTGAAPDLKGGIELEDLSFRYRPDRPPAIDRLTLGVRAGAVVGIVGRSGSGKSTLMRLIQGFYPIQEGRIRFDGIDLREMDVAHLRRSIGVVLQENFLFRGTIRDNIAMTRPDAPIDAVVEAARLAGADEFIERLPEGYDTLVEEGASNLSGGQKQRLAIARALLPRPRLLILDEATSALDPDSEAIVMNNLDRIARGRTVLMVTHRLSTLTGCDVIAVLEQGRLVDLAPHRVLLERCEIYRHLWRQQNRGQS